MKATTVAATVFVGLAVCSDGYAQTPRRARGTLDICHGSQQYVVRPADSAATAPLDYEGSIILDVRADEAFRVRIVDPNPLLFEYRAGPIERTPSVNYEALTSFGSALTPLLPASPGQAGQPSVRYTPPTTLAELRHNVEIDVGVLYGLADRTADLISRTAAPGGDCFAEGGVESRRAVKEEVAQWELSSLATHIVDDYDRLRAEALEIVTQTGNQEQNQEEEEEDLRDILYLSAALHLETGVKETLRNLQAFAQDVADIDEPIVVVTEIAFVAGQRQSVVIDIRTVPDNAHAAGQAQRSTESISVIVEPYTTVRRLRVSTGIVWTSLDYATFAARKSGEALVISKEVGQVSKVVPTMLNVFPRRLSGDTVSLFGQFGGAQVDRNSVFFLGGGVALFEDRLVVSLGWAFARVDKLLNQKVDDVIESAEDIRRGTKFADSRYLSLSFAF